MRRLTATVIVAICLSSCERSRGWFDFARMTDQRRADPYEASQVFSDGMVMRRPPAGTVTWQEEQMPPRTRAAVTPEQVSAGRHHYGIHCAVCHGVDGSGRAVMADNMPEHRPPSLLSSEVAGSTDMHLFEVITSGQHRMPAYGWSLAAGERWEVIAYLRSVQASHAPTPVEPHHHPE